MKRSGWVGATRLWTLALYALASLSVGFSHNPALLSKERFAQFAMPDGTQPFICSTNGNTGRTGFQKIGGCKACRLIAAPGLPPSASDRAWLFVPADTSAVTRIERFAFIGPNPALPTLGARGPPRA